MKRKSKVYLEDLIFHMHRLLDDARRSCNCPGDKFGYDLFVCIRDLSRRAVRVSRSRCFASANREGDKVLVDLYNNMKKCLELNRRYGR